MLVGARLERRISIAELVGVQLKRLKAGCIVEKGM